MRDQPNLATRGRESSRSTRTHWSRQERGFRRERIVVGMGTQTFGEMCTPASVRPSNDDDANTLARSEWQVRDWPKKAILIERINRPHEKQDSTSLPMRRSVVPAVTGGSGAGVHGRLSAATRFDCGLGLIGFVVRSHFVSAQRTLGVDLAQALRISSSRAPRRHEQRGPFGAPAPFGC